MVLHNRVLHRPDLADGQPWAHFTKHDWAIVTLRRFLRLRFHVSKILREHPPNKPVVIGVHPHGVAADYRVAMESMLHEAMPGRRCFVLAASLLFALPLVRELVLWTRCIDARKAVGHSLLVVPGGEAEQELYLARIGFVKLAMQHGAALVPCYAFGTVDLYDVSPAQHAANAKGFLWTLSKRYGVHTGPPVPNTRSAGGTLGATSSGDPNRNG